MEKFEPNWDGLGRVKDAYVREIKKLEMIVTKIALLLLCIKIFKRRLNIIFQKALVQINITRQCNLNKSITPFQLKYNNVCIYNMYI